MASGMAASSVERIKIVCLVCWSAECVAVAVTFNSAFYFVFIRDGYWYVSVAEVNVRNSNCGVASFIMSVVRVVICYTRLRIFLAVFHIVMNRWVTFLTQLQLSTCSLQRYCIGPLFCLTTLVAMSCKSTYMV
jgi:hypothetical protein